MGNEKENDAYFEDLLDKLSEEDETEEEKAKAEEEKQKLEDEQRLKNKNAEEKRKRLEAEAKAKAEQEEKDKAEKDKALADTKNLENEEKKNADRVNKLGEQLVKFKKDYPNIDIEALDKDVHFKRYIDGKLLGKKDFTELYKDYLDLQSNFSGKSEEDLRKNYEKKADSGSGSFVNKGAVEAGVFTEEELEKLAEKMPFMNDKEVDKIMEKFDKSLNFYKNKKK